MKGWPQPKLSIDVPARGLRGVACQKPTKEYTTTDHFRDDVVNGSGMDARACYDIN